MFASDLSLDKYLILNLHTCEKTNDGVELGGDEGLVAGGGAELPRAFRSLMSSRPLPLAASMRSSDACCVAVPKKFGAIGGDGDEEAVGVVG